MDQINTIFMDGVTNPIRSKCCKTSMTIAGSGTGEGSTHFYICAACKQACDFEMGENETRS